MNEESEKLIRIKAPAWPEQVYEPHILCTQAFLTKNECMPKAQNLPSCYERLPSAA